MTGNVIFLAMVPMANGDGMVAMGKMRVGCVLAGREKKHASPANAKGFPGQPILEVGSVRSDFIKKSVLLH